MDFNKLKNELNKKLEENIPDYKEKKKALANSFQQALRNEKTCPYCGAIIKNNSNFCSSCGKSLKDYEIQEERKRVEEEKKREKEEKEYQRERKKEEKNEEREKVKQEQQRKKEEKEERIKQKQQKEKQEEKKFPAVFGVLGILLTILIIVALVGVLGSSSTNSVPTTNTIAKEESTNINERKEEKDAIEFKQIENTTNNIENAPKEQEKDKITETKKEEEPKEEKTVQRTPEEILEEKLPLETAKKAVMVCITNNSATDVFKPDGNTLDPSKFHNYSNLKFKEEIGENEFVWFFFTLRKDGTWTVKDESTWHVEKLYLDQHPYGGVLRFTGDVRFDGTNYIVTGNVKSAAQETYIEANDPSKVGEEDITQSDEASVVTEKLLK